MKNTKTFFILSIFIVILIMSIGYSAFATTLAINSNSIIAGIWDVRITNINVKSVSDGCSPR